MPDSKMFGEILLELDKITDLQLQEALQKQATTMSHRKIGEILVRLGYMAKTHIEQALAIQNPERSADDIHSEIFAGFDTSQTKKIDAPETADMFGIRLPRFIESPEQPAKKPTIVISISEIYGLGKLRYDMSGIGLSRQPDESNEDLAERAAQEIKILILEKLNDDVARKQFEANNNEHDTETDTNSFYKNQPPIPNIMNDAY